MSREAPTNGEVPKPTLQRRPSYTLLGSPDPAPIILTAAAVLSFCAGCTNACAMLGVFQAPGIRATGVTHVTGSLTKAGMVLANGPAATSVRFVLLYCSMARAARAASAYCSSRRSGSAVVIGSPAVVKAVSRPLVVLNG